MRRLNSILHITNNNTIAIVHSKKPLPRIIGKRVVDESVNTIGVISDIFGPVDKPYIIIKLHKNINNIEDLPGKILYVYSKSKG